MKTLITLILSIISIPLFSQSKGIRCIYSSSMEVSKGVYEMENEIAKKMVIRDIQEDKKIYSLTAVGNKYLFTKEPESVDKVPLMVDERNIYIDLDDSIKVTQSEFVNKLYLVKGHANRLDWDVEEKTENVLGKTCYKATLRQDPRITVWFTPEIPFACAPLGYYGLPGLVVRITTPAYTLSLESMTEVDNIELKEPTEGTAITEEEYSEKVDHNYKKLLDSADKVTYME